MQYIELQIEDENGQVMKKSDINFVDVVLHLIDKDKEKNLKLLWSIDPYGLTMINNLQAPQLISELEKLAEKAPEVKDQINGLMNLAKEISNHQYLKFIGD